MIRKFRRDQLRKVVGNKNLSTSWERQQRKRYGHWYKEICIKKSYVFKG